MAHAFSPEPQLDRLIKILNNPKTKEDQVFKAMNELDVMVGHNHDLDIASVAPTLHGYLRADVRDQKTHVCQLKAIKILARTNNPAMRALATDNVVISKLAGWLSNPTQAIFFVALTALRNIFPSHYSLTETLDTRVMIKPLVALLQKKDDLFFAYTAELLLVLVFENLENKKMVQGIVPPLLVAKLKSPDNPSIPTHEAALKLLVGIFFNNPDMASRLAIEQAVRTDIFPFLRDESDPIRQKHTYEFAQVFLHASHHVLEVPSKAIPRLIHDIESFPDDSHPFALTNTLRLLFMDYHRKEPCFKATVAPLIPKLVALSEHVNINVKLNALFGLKTILRGSPDLQARFLTEAHISAIRALLSDKSIDNYTAIEKQVVPLLSIISQNTVPATSATGAAEAHSFFDGAALSGAVGVASAPEGSRV